MEKGDIAPTVHQHVACMFEGLLVQDPKPQLIEEKHRWWRKPENVTEIPEIEQIARMWKPNELPMKSVIHMINQLGIGVEVYTYLDQEFHEAIEHWLARKGAAVSVYHYLNISDLFDDFKYNRDVHTLFTPFQEDALLLGMRATCVRPDGTFGI
jgi:hypothetical protein